MPDTCWNTWSPVVSRQSSVASRQSSVVSRQSPVVSRQSSVIYQFYRCSWWLLVVDSFIHVFMLLLFCAPLCLCGYYPDHWRLTEVAPGDIMRWADCGRDSLEGAPKGKGHSRISQANRPWPGTASGEIPSGDTDGARHDANLAGERTEGALASSCPFLLVLKRR